MHDVIRGSGDQIQLTVFPEDFIIEPDPATGGGGGGPRPPAVGDVVIVAALPDPLGADTTSPSSPRRRPRPRSGAASASDAVQLGNRGDTLMLIDPEGEVVDKVAYQANEVRPGRTVAFRR